MFDPNTFQGTIDECQGQIKMIEIKLAQGANKPAGRNLLCN
jgi:hypothetical protein